MRFRVLDCGSGFEPETFQIRNQKDIHSPQRYPYESVSLEFRARKNVILCHVTDRQKKITLIYILVLEFTPVIFEVLMSLNVIASRVMTSCRIVNTDH
jgi:hypothetical protein